MKFVDEWPGNDVADQIGHTPGAWDCPCGPWVRTDADSDNPDEHGPSTGKTNHAPTRRNTSCGRSTE